MKALLMILIFFPGVLSAQVELDLQLCREMAIRNSKEMEIADRQHRKAMFDTKSYRADYLPKLSAVGVGFYNQKKYNYKLKGGYLPTYKPGEHGQLEPNVMIDPATQKPVIGSDGNPVFNEYAFLPDIRLQLKLRGVYMAGAQLEQPVYLGGKVRAAHRMAQLGEDIAVENIRLSRSEIVVATDEAYWQLLRVGEQVSAAEKYRQVVKELLQNLRDAQVVGMATPNDVLKAQVRYNEAGLMLQKAQNGQVLASMNLCRLVGLNLQTELHLQDSLTDKIDPRIWALDTSVEQRPDYTMLAQEVDLRKKQVDLTRADFLPQIGVTAGYGYGGGLQLNGDDEASATFSAMAAVKIPVFHWGEGKNKVRSARMEEEISRLNLEKTTDLMRLQITSARFSVTDAQKRVEMARNALSQAKENLKISNDQYQAGMENLTALLEAQAQWQETWSQWIDAKALLHLSVSQYLKAIGKLD